MGDFVLKINSKFSASSKTLELWRLQIFDRAIADDKADSDDPEWTQYTLDGMKT